MSFPNKFVRIIRKLPCGPECKEQWSSNCGPECKEVTRKYDHILEIRIRSVEPRAVN